MQSTVYGSRSMVWILQEARKLVYMVLLADIPSSGHQRSQTVSEPWGHVEVPEEREGHMYW